MITSEQARAAGDRSKAEIVAEFRKALGPSQLRNAVKIVTLAAEQSDDFIAGLVDGMLQTDRPLVLAAVGWFVGEAFLECVTEQASKRD